MATSETESIGLIELLERLKADLLSAPADDAPMFSIDEVKLELKVAVTRSAEGGIHVYVVQLGASGKRDDVQTVTVTLTPWLNKKKRLKSMPAERRQLMKKATSQISTSHGNGASSVTR